MATLPFSGVGTTAARGMRRGQLFRKYLLLILTLVTSALLASGAISVYFTYQENKSALASLQHEKALAAASRIEQYIRQIEQQLAYAALPQLDAADIESRRIEFLKLLRQAPEVTDISRLDAAGHEQIAVSRLGMDVVGSGKDRSQEPAFRGAKRGQAWFGPVYFRKETEPYMTIAIRSGGDTGPVTVAEVNLKFIWDVVSRIKIGDKGKAYVVDRNGFLVADPDIGLVLRKTSLSHLAHVKAAAGKEKSDELAMLSTDLAGTQVLTSVARIEPLDWKVFVEQPVAEVYEKLNASIVRTALLLLAGLVISALGALALARGMVRPIRTLSEGAQRIGAGELDQKIEIHTGDELEALADRFNRMSAQLRESYAGLERKVDERTSELKNSLDQQTAISEILRVISSSPTDVQPVLEAVAERAAHLCDAPFAFVVLVEGGVLRPAAAYSVEAGPGSGYANPAALKGPFELNRGYVIGRAALDRETVHVPDIVPLLDTEYQAARPVQEKFGFRALLAVPLMREGGAYGVILIWRREPRAFSPDEIALLQTFARQAAIAIDNVRLFNETKESLDQQTAISEILRVISSSPGDVKPMLNAVAERALKLCDAAESTIVLVEEDGLRFAAGFGSTQTLEEGELMPLTRGSATGRAVIDRALIHMEDLAAAPEEEFPVGREMQRRIGHHAILSVPLMREDRAIGAIALWRMEARRFTEKQIALVKTFADQAAIAIENVRLFNETKEALEQQTAIAEILRVISASPTDVLPVLDAIAERAARLCDASAASMYLTDEKTLRHLASKGPSPDPVSSIEALPINRDSISGRALLERKTIQVRDMLAEGTEYPVSYELAQRFGHRTVVVMPLYREGQPFGTILLRRREIRPFSDREIGLLRTFGDQAAIALENVRLFNETKEALERQTAIAEVLKTISRTTFELESVLETLIENATRLCKAEVGSVFMREGEVYKLAVNHGASPEYVEFMHRHPISPGYGSVVARVALTRQVVHIDDARTDPTYTWKEVPNLFDFRSIFGVPMLRQGEPTGVLVMWRKDARPFSPHDIQLVATFADQAVIAIENVRLFNETKEALDQQRASAEVLAAISSSIADTKPVFDVILQSCQRLFAGDTVGLTLVQDDGMLDVGANAGPGFDELKKIFPQPVTRDTASGTAILERKVMAYPDVDAGDMPPKSRDGCHAIGTQSIAFAPMLFEGRGIGTLWVGRPFKAPFSDKQLTLLKTFAEQAVIAIQNARLFREIQDKSRQVEIASQHKMQFLANMSHELRTPLNAILGYSELLFDGIYGPLGDRVQGVLERVRHNGKHLLGLINDVLDLSKIDAGQLTLALDDYSMSALVKSTLASTESLAREKGLALKASVADGLPLGWGDERRLTQVLLNIVGNAIKFTDEGVVEVTATAADGHFDIQVRDTGPGIAQADQARIFEEFQQVDVSSTRTKGGTGLGLAIARRIVEMHGGTISVTSEIGAGSTFRIIVPVRTHQRREAA